MAKASTNPANSRVDAVPENGTPWMSRMRKVRWPRWSRAIRAVEMMATSMMRLPTIVYTTNVRPARLRLSPPQVQMRNANGMSMNSQNT